MSDSLSSEPVSSSDLVNQTPMLEAASSALFIKTFPVGPLQCNCTVVGNPVTKKAMVIDPGGDPDIIMGILESGGYSVSRILHTHAHFDHFLASGEMRERTGAKLCLHKADRPLWEHLPEQCARYNISFNGHMPLPEHWLEDEETFSADVGDGQAIFTPGHTPGSMSFWFESEKLLIAGDTLFKGAVGRTDLWGGDYPTIERSIRQRLYTLDETTTVVAGHGPNTSIGQEMRYNQFIRA